MFVVYFLDFFVFVAVVVDITLNLLREIECVDKPIWTSQ